MNLHFKSVSSVQKCKCCFLGLPLHVTLRSHFTIQYLFVNLWVIVFVSLFTSFVSLSSRSLSFLQIEPVIWPSSWASLSMSITTTNGWPGPCLNIKTVYPRYSNLMFKYKTVARPSYLWHGDPYTGKTISLYWDSPQDDVIWNWYQLIPILLSSNRVIIFYANSNTMCKSLMFPSSWIHWTVVIRYNGPGNVMHLKIEITRNCQLYKPSLHHK